MSRLQRRLLAALGMLSLVVAVAVVVASNRDAPPRGPDAQLTASDRTDRDDAEDASEDDGGGALADAPSTKALEPVRGGTALPQTTPPTTTPPSTEPPSTTTTTAPPALTSKGTVFGPPPDSSPRAAVSGDCRSLASPGWTIKDCGTVAGREQPIAWLIESKGKGLRAMLLEAAGTGQWRPYLSAGDDLGARWTEIKARSAAGPGGGSDLMVGFGFRAKSGGALAVELVHAGQVAVHVDLEKGSARVSKGQLDTWAAQPDGTYLHQVIRWSQEAWRVVDAEAVSAALVPPSHL